MNLKRFLEIMNLPLNLTVDEILESLIIYLRKSRKDMDYFKDEPIEKTLQRHEKELQDFIINIFGKPIPEHNIYREVASGDTIDDRPVMQEVLSIIEEDNIKGVVCIEIERLARGNTVDQGVIAQTFQYTDTKIITPIKIYNLDNEDDLSYFEDGLYQARKYLKYTKRILARGRLRSVKDGKYVGSILPYGFNKVKLENEKGYVLVENKAESKVVRLIADLFLNGLNTTYTVKDNDTVSTIAKTFGTRKDTIIAYNLNLKVGLNIKLTVNNKSINYTIKENDTLDTIAAAHKIEINKIHIPNNIFTSGEVIKIILEDMRPTNISHYLNYLKIPPRKSKDWTANMIRNILKSPTIYGYLTWDRRKTTKTLVNGHIIKKNPLNDNYTLVEGKHTAILNEEIKNKIEAKLEANSIKTVPEEKELKNPLVGLVVCSYCGNNMTRRPYYVKKGAKAVKKRVYDVDKHKLRLLLREHKGNYSLNDIARALKVSKNCVDHWFSSTDDKFSMPHADKWEDLKQLLNISTDEFDAAITTFEERITPAHVDTLICSKPRCKCVSSDLELVEDKILKTLNLIKKEYDLYINNYEEEVKKEITNNNELIEIIDHEIDKVKIQLERACELVETGAYTQDLFIKRKKILDEQLESLFNQKIELSKNNNKEKELKTRIKAVPIIEDVLTKYSNSLTAEEKNELLSTIIDKVIYTKDKGGRYLKENFSLKVILRVFD
jgi:hypothetical protein